MLPRTERDIFAASDRRGRFDLDSVRGILERAAVEQHRLEVERDDTYTREELEEMAAEAGISREALARALRRRRARASPAWRRGTWLRWLARGALAALAGLAFVGLMLAFPTVAEILFWTVIAVLVLVLLGAVPM